MSVLYRTNSTYKIIFGSSVKRMIVLRLIFILFILHGSAKDILCQKSHFSHNECDTSLNCKHNMNNLIYKANRSYTYLMKTTVPAEEFQGFDTANPASIFDGDLFLALKVLPGCFDDQTMIKYEYSDGDSIQSFEITGLVENRKQVWIHPPRSFIAEIEFSPYYEYRVGKRKWSSKFLYFNNRNPNISDRSTIWLKSKYHLDNDTVYTLNDESYVCRKITIRTKYRGKVWFSSMLFSESLGFVSVDVNFINGRSYSLELIAYDPDYCFDESTRSE